MASRESSERRRSGLLKQKERNSVVAEVQLYKICVCVCSEDFHVLPSAYELRTCSGALTDSSVRGVLPHQGWRDGCGPLGHLNTHRYTQTGSNMTLLMLC